MSDEVILDYSRHKLVNRLFVLIMLVVIAAGAYLMSQSYAENGGLSPDIMTAIILLAVTPAGIVVLAAIMGAASKRGIDYKKGEWETKKVRMTFEEYERAVEEYEDAYGNLYSSSGGPCGCCCLLPTAIIIGLLILFHIEFGEGTVLGSPVWDGVVFQVIMYSAVGAAGYLIGFTIPSIDANAFFRRPFKGSVYNFAKVLSRVPGVSAGLNVEVGRRGTARTIMSTEVKASIEGLPDVVAIKVQVSESTIVYPYLVGSIYKSRAIEAHVDRVKVRTAYPALLEYSMDKDVGIIVARFDIPKKTSSVPNISHADFSKLAVLLVERLKELYSASS